MPIRRLTLRFGKVAQGCWVEGGNTDCLKKSEFLIQCLVLSTDLALHLSSWNICVLFFKAVSFKVVGDKQQFFYVLERANRYNVAHYGSKLSVFAGTV